MEALTHWTPVQVTVWRFRRLLKATYWGVHLLVEGWVQEALHTLPLSKDGTLYLVGDSSDKSKRGTKNLLTQKGHISEHHPWFFGMSCAPLIANWDVYRLPVAFCPLQPKSHSACHTKNALFRALADDFWPPPWAKRIMIEGDAAYSHKTIDKWDASAMRMIPPGAGLLFSPLHVRVKLPRARRAKTW